MEPYLNEFSSVLESLDKQSATIKEIASIIKQAKETDSAIFICGNGGSAAVASHFSNDLHKLGFKVWALTNSVPSITMWANDYNYAFVFAYQMTGRSNFGDVLIVFSGSGMSKNIIQACHYAHANEMTIIAIVGIDGGVLKHFQTNLNINKLIHIPTDMFHSEDGFSIISHWLTSLLSEEITQDEPDKDGAAESAGPDN